MTLERIVIMLCVWLTVNAAVTLVVYLDVDNRGREDELNAWGVIKFCAIGFAIGAPMLAYYATKNALKGRV